MKNEQQERLLKAAKATLNIMAGYYVDDEYEELKEAISAAESAAPGENLEAELADVLQLLCDHQNGCPLPKYEKKWTEAMRRSADLLARFDARKTEGAK